MTRRACTCFLSVCKPSRYASNDETSCRDVQLSPPAACRSEGEFYEMSARDERSESYPDKALEYTRAVSWTWLGNM